MDTRDATEKYERAAELYSEERFEEARAILASLEQVFPGNTDVLFKRALCLAALQRGYEARLLFKKLQVVSGDGPWTPYLATHQRTAEEPLDMQPVPTEIHDERPRRSWRFTTRSVWAVAACMALIVLCAIGYMAHVLSSRPTQSAPASSPGDHAQAPPPAVVSSAPAPAPAPDTPDASPSREPDISSLSTPQLLQMALERMSNSQLLRLVGDNSLVDQPLALLGKRITADDTPELCRLLKKDRKLGKRAFSARLIGYKHLLGGTGALVDALKSDASCYVRREAAQALGWLEQRRGVEALEQALARDPEAMVRKQAAWALRQIIGREAIPKLEAALQTESSADVLLTIRWMMDVDFKSTRPPELIPGQPVCGSYRGMLYMVYVPTGNPVGEKWLLIVSVHGTDGSPDGYLEMCREDAEKYGIVVLAPYFDFPVFPTYDVLNIGLAMERSDLSILEIIDTLAEKIPLDTSRFYLFGHSKGGQFVSRFVLAHPERIIRAAAGSPGSYVMPDPNVLFPHGTKPNPQAPDLAALDFGKLAQTPMLVLVGQKEKVCQHDLAKGFVEATQAYADEHRVSCKVKYVAVPKGVHAGVSNYPSASRFLYQGLRSRQNSNPGDTLKPR